MKTLRLVLSGITVLLLTLGYLGSQWSALNQQSQDWAHRMDEPAIVALSLLLFLGAVVLFFIPDREGDETST